MVVTRGRKRNADAADAGSAHEGGNKPIQKKGRKGKGNGSGATKADHALAVIASVDAGGADPQEKLQKPHTQVSLATAFGGGNGDSSHDEQRPATSSEDPVAGVSSDKDTAHEDNDEQEQQQQQQQQQQPLKQTGLKAVAAGKQKGTVREPSKQAKRQGKSGTSNHGSAADGDGDDEAAGSGEKQEAEEKLVVLDKSDHPVAKKRDGRTNQQVEAAKEATEKLQSRLVKINRAPTLTLWVKVVAEREGFSEDTAVTFGKAISGILANSRGRSLGIISDKDLDAKKAPKEVERASVFNVSNSTADAQTKGLFHGLHEAKKAPKAEAERASVFGMNIKVAEAKGVQVALGADGKPTQPKQAHAYLQRAFKDDLAEAKKSMETLAAAYAPDDIGHQAYKLYEKFRPMAGWGQKGDLDLNFIEALAENKDQ